MPANRPKRIILTDQVFPTTDIEREILAEVGAVLEVLEDSSSTAIREVARDADGILTTYAPLDKETIDSLSSCRVIARYGIGVDNIDLDTAREKGIPVTNVPDYCIEEVADHTIALLLTITRKIVRGHDLVMSGGWGISELRPMHRLRGQVLGLIGLGHIGEAVALRARTLGLRLLVFDPYVARVRVEGLQAEHLRSLEDLLGKSDIISVHAPLTEETHGLIDALAISKMRPGSFLINTARGPIVDPSAVIDALNSGHIAGAALDVLPNEPPPDTGSLRAHNFVLTPHAAFYSEEAIRESQTKAATAVAMALGGQEPHYRVA